jgi:ATPase complex subunit ATP10
VQLNLQENPLKSFVLGLFLRSLRSNVPKQHQDTYLVSNEDMTYLREVRFANILQSFFPPCV